MIRPRAPGVLLCCVALGWLCGGRGWGGNLFLNPGFEETDAGGRPLSWQVYGDGPALAETPHSGRRAAHVVARKRRTVCQRVAVEPDRDYAFSAWVRPVQDGLGSYLVLNACWVDRDGKTLRERFHCPGAVRGEGYQRVRWVWHTTPKTARLSICLGASGGPGFLVDDVELTDLGPGSRCASDADPIHGLAELAARRRFKPYGLLLRDGAYAGERLVFRDTATGAAIWKMTRDPHNVRHWYSNIAPWSCDGSVMLLTGQRERAGAWVIPLDGGPMRYVSPHYNPLWSPVKPGVYYQGEFEPNFMTLYDQARSRSEMVAAVRARRAGSKRCWIVERDIRTGARRVLFEGDRIGLRDISPDGRTLLLSGAWRPPTHGVWWMDADTGETQRVDVEGRYHQIWFTKEPDYAVWFGYANYSPTTYRPGGYLLRPGWDKPKRLDRRSPFSHGAASPDGTRIAYFAGEFCLRDWDGAKRHVLWDLVGKGGHTSWRVDPDWLVLSLANNTIHRAVLTPDGRAYPMRICVANTGKPFSAYCTEVHPETSPDGTKIGYTSSMMGSVDFYIAVNRLPDPVRNLRARVEGGQVRLTWDAPIHCREVKGYLVYRAARSGGPFVCLTDAPRPERAFDAQLDSEAPCFLVTAVEHSGLEGRPSREVCAANDGWVGGVTHYCELEDGETTMPMLLDFDASAAGLGAVWIPELFADAREANLREVHDEGARCKIDVGAGQAQPTGAVRRVLTVPRSGAYRLWLRAKSVWLDGAIELHLDGQRVAAAQLPKGDAWRWLQLGQDIRLEQGERVVRLASATQGLHLDQLCLTSDPACRPDHLALYDRAPPPAPPQVRVVAVHEFAVALSWPPCPAPDFSHYNLYCAAGRDPDPVQALRIASPAAPQYLDWGLRNNVEYRYRVTCVDRRGNESPPSPPVTTRPRAIDCRVINPAVEPCVLQPDQELAFEVEIPAPGRYAVWVELAAVEPGRGGELEAVVGPHSTPWRPNWQIVSTGHGGPHKGLPFWDTVGSSEWGEGDQFELDGGRTRIALKPVAPHVMQIKGVRVTNDLGFRPKGIVSFLPEEMD